MHNAVYATPQERRRQKAIERQLPALRRPTPEPGPDTDEPPPPR